MQDEYQALHDAQWAAESTREQRADAFREPLIASAAAVRRRVLDLRLVVQHEKLLDPDTDTGEAQAFALQLMAQVAEVAAEAAHVQRQQALFQHEVTEFEELEAVQSDIELKDLLWGARGEVAELLLQAEDVPLAEVRAMARRPAWSGLGAWERWRLLDRGLQRLCTVAYWVTAVFVHMRAGPGTVP